MGRRKTFVRFLSAFLGFMVAFVPLFFRPAMASSSLNACASDPACANLLVGEFGVRNAVIQPTVTSVASNVVALPTASSSVTTTVSAASGSRVLGYAVGGSAAVVGGAAYINESRIRAAQQELYDLECAAQSLCTGLYLVDGRNPSNKTPVRDAVTFEQYTGPEYEVIGPPAGFGRYPYNEYFRFIDFNGDIIGSGATKKWVEHEVPNLVEEMEPIPWEEATQAQRNAMADAHPEVLADVVDNITIVQQELASAANGDTSVQFSTDAILQPEGATDFFIGDEIGVSQPSVDPDTGTGTGSDPDTGGDSDTGGDPDTGTGTGSDPDTGGDPGTGTGTGSNPGTGGDSDSGSSSDPDSDSDTDGDSGADSDTATEPEPIEVTFPDQMDVTVDNWGEFSEPTPEVLNPDTFSATPWPQYLSQQVQGRFPFGFFNYNASSGASTCPSYTFFNRVFELCILRDLLGLVKYPVIVGYFISSVKNL